MYRTVGGADLRRMESAELADSFGKDFRRFFLRGLAAMLPTILTLMIVIYAFQFIQKHIGQHLDVVAQWMVIQIRSFIDPHIPWTLRGTGVEWEKIRSFWGSHGLVWIGIALAFLLIYVFGRIVASFIGRTIWRLVDNMLSQLPFVRHIYPQVKQVTDYVLADGKIQFSRVVAVEYPRKGVWAIGLVTAPGMKRLQSVVGGELLTVFVPSSPTPMTGYTITIKREDVVEMPLSIDEALRFTISGGVILPPGQQAEDAEARLTRQAVLPLPDGEKETER